MPVRANRGGQWFIIWNIGTLEVDLVTFKIPSKSLSKKILARAMCKHVFLIPLLCSQRIFSNELGWFYFPKYNPINNLDWSDLIRMKHLLKVEDWMNVVNVHAWAIHSEVNEHGLFLYWKLFIWLPAPSHMTVKISVSESFGIPGPNSQLYLRHHHMLQSDSLASHRLEADFDVRRQKSSGLTLCNLLAYLTQGLVPLAARLISLS